MYFIKNIIKSAIHIEMNNHFKSFHKHIKTTLRYDQTDDKMFKDYFNKVQSEVVDNLTQDDKAKVWLDKLLSNEIDLKTFKTGIDVLLPHRRKDNEIGYI